MKAIVTGGAGFIGSHIAEALVARGDEVHVIDDLWDGKRERVPEGAVFHQIDIRDTKALTPLFEGAQVVFHEAARPRVPYSIDYPEESNDVNVNGTLSVLIASRDAKVGRVVYAGSSSAYGEQETLPLIETMAPQPVNPYGLQKLVGEYYLQVFAQTYGLSTVSLRYFNVYGCHMDPEGGYALAIPKFLAMRARGETLTITGDGEQTRDFTHIDDVVRANLLAAESKNVGKGEVINIGAGRNISVNTLADLIGGEKTYIPARSEAKHTLAHIARAKELLGWEPTISLEEGIAKLKQDYGV